MSSLGKDWSSLQMAPKQKGGLGPWLGDREADLKWTADTHATVFQAEVRAISECAQAMLEGDCRGKPVVICSDNQIALRALDGYLVRSREVLRCRQLLEELSRANSVRLLWVPGHSGVVGNKRLKGWLIEELRAIGPDAAAWVYLNATWKRA